MDLSKLVWFLFTFCLYLASALISKSQDGLRGRRVAFKTYWNIPSFQCARYNLGFDHLTRRYNIIQNKDDQFRGNEISILYDPGVFPAILNNGTQTILRNGGVPQEGNISWHLNTFAKHLQELIPIEKFSGVGIIDFESWRPVYRQNFGTLTPYKDLSVQIEKQKHPLWSNPQIQGEAKRRFEENARSYMRQTLFLAQKMRPNATWGYYAYPYCFNMNTNNHLKDCPAEVPPENDGIRWLFRATDNLNPSVYLRENGFTATQRKELINGRIKEAQRIMSTLRDNKNRSLIPYFTLQYPDTSQFLSKVDIENSIDVFKTKQVDGVIIWGSSNHVNTEAKCKSLYHYVDTVFGPALSK
ncbi:hypothetical protein FQA39_LY18319 [Lamprigera yunnana]|nr:hypothetical protein FQA39_LY18319 [Lamprigera yunnana]